MAKYCFYCGQELTTGEKCKCRNNPSAAGSGKKTTSTGAKHTEKRSQGGPKIYSARSAKSSRPSFRLRTFTDQLRTIFPTLSSGAMSGSNYIVRPATKIRQESLRVKRPFSILNIFIFVFLTSLLGVLMVRSGSYLFVSMMRSVFDSALSFCYSHPIQSFFTLALIVFLFVLIMTFCFYIASRFSNRKPTLRKVFDLVSISLVYVQIIEVILLIMILLGSRGAFSLIFISLILMGLTQLLAFRSALGLSEDTIFLMIIFVYSASYLLIKLLLYVLIRLLAYI